MDGLMPELSVVIVTDMTMDQSSLKATLSERVDFRIIAIVKEPETAAATIRLLRPDVIILSLSKLYIDGKQLLQNIQSLERICKVVISDQPAQETVLHAKLLEAGATVCLSKRELDGSPTSFFEKINIAAYDLCLKRAIGESIDGGVKWDEFDRNARRETRNGHSFPIPRDEDWRLAFLESRNLANAVAERQFDVVTNHAAKVTGFPVCLLTFIDEHMQWVKSAYGFETSPIARELAFCNYTISQRATFVVADATTDVRFARNPLVTGEQGIRSYVGHPVMTKDGHAIGALCLIDYRPRTPTKQTIEQLAGMAEIIAEMIDLRPPKAA